MKMHKVYILLWLWLLNNSEHYLTIVKGSSITCEPKPPCGCELSDGSKFIDLSPMQTHPAPMFRNVKDSSSSTGYFNVDLCRSFQCNGQTKVCYSLNGGTIGVGIDFDTEYDEASESATFVYTQKQSKQQRMQKQGDNVTNVVGKSFTTKIKLKCDQSLPGIGTMEQMENRFISFETTLSSKYACFQESPSSKSKLPKNGLSIGSILCIVLLVLITVYIAGGILINKYARKLEGKELFPNNTFWSSLPSLIKAGCVFVVAKIRRTDDGYESI